MIPSILDSIKKNLGIESADTDFDEEIITHINSMFMTLFQLGVGPNTAPYSITDKNDEWTSFLVDPTLFMAVKSYITLKVRMLFDPPASSFVLEAFNREIKELEWRLNIQAE